MTQQELDADRARRSIELGLIAHRMMIMWLAITSMIIGPVIVVTGAPAFFEDWFSPWSRVMLGLLAFAPAVCTVIGAAMGTRTTGGWWTQLLGLLGQAVWYVAMLCAHVGLLIQEGPQWVRLGEPLAPGISGRGYVPLVYLGLLGLAIIPLVTMLLLGRPRR